MIAGRWTGTMDLTEPQAGSDLNAIKTRAERAGDGTYRLFGQKIFITHGEHDMAENIVHLVLARLPGAPAGTRGLSLFVAPKFLVNPDGTLGARNDVRCAGIEHKIGIHASPTCVMIYGESEGAKAWLVAEENRGLAAMFMMMNAARLGIGAQAVAVGERAYQQALAYARERRQGRGPKGGDGMAPIIEHPDVRRMLMTMKAAVHAARGICHLTAAAIDLASHGRDEQERKAAADRAALLTPIAKAFSADVGDETASLGVQVHGGMGYVEETGAAQLMRDARIAAIYEGANGIHGIDLVQRKLPLAGGETVRSEIAGIRDIASAVAARGGAAFGATADRLAEAAGALEEATAHMQTWLKSDPESALAGASPYLRLFGLTLGGACLAKAGLGAGARATRGTEHSSQSGGHASVLRFVSSLQPGKPGAHVLEAALGVLGFDTFDFILKLQQLLHSLGPGYRGPLLFT
jgi:alkylation response protein AidB-like acyl-CoA dehydrogenase